jgi:hypothetical protein
MLVLEEVPAPPMRSSSQLQPAELAEAARLGLTANDLEQLIEDLAQKEFTQVTPTTNRAHAHSPGGGGRRQR